MTTPTIFVTDASRKKKGEWIPPNYTYFRQLQSTPKIFATYKGRVQHECFTSQGVIRYFIKDQVRPQEKLFLKIMSKAYHNTCDYVIKAMTHFANGGTLANLKKDEMFIEEHLPAKD